MYKSVFITATDTGVGKTTVSYTLAKLLKEKNINVAYFKPIETGVNTLSEDAYKLSTITKQTLDEIVLYTFKNPLSPYAAMLTENKNIDLKKILNHYDYLTKKYDFVIVEGAGGLLVPILENYTYFDLIKDLNIPVLIVSRAKLGTINHTLLTVKALDGVKILGIIMNGFNGDDISEDLNPMIIEKFSNQKIIAKCNFSENPDEECYKKLKEVFLQLLI